VHQLVVEAVILMRNNGMDRLPEKSLPVCERDRTIGHISYAELMDFLTHEEAGSNIYTQKLNFDMGSALILIRGIKRDVRKKVKVRLLSAAITLIVIGIGLLFFRSAYYGEESSNRKGQTALQTTGKMADRVVKVPRGKQSSFKLPDGTLVWLNAGSTISYPALFTGKQRIVFLTGEAYFEVVKVVLPASNGLRVPFVVKTEKQEIEVLGTHFNVSAYPDDHRVKTVLLEGSIKITPTPGGNAVTLKPNQQSVLTGSHMDVTAVDPELATAWKNGDFSFRKEQLGDIMQVLARWYDIEVVFENEEVAKVEFGGTITKSSTLKKVLSLLELTGSVHFRIEGKKVFVSL